VEGLVAKSVLTRADDAAGGTRYRMLDTLRQYGAEWLRELGERDLMARRHRDWYLRLAEWGEQHWFGTAQTEVFRRLYAEHVNVGAALEHCLTAPGQARTGLHMAASLWFYWVGCGFLDEGRYWLDRALGLDAEPSGTRAKALWVNGYVAIKQGDSSGAVMHLEESQAEAQRLDDRTALANAVHRLGCVALVNDEHALAEVLFKETLAQYEALGELNTSVLMARVEFAMNTAFQGDLKAAAEMCERVHAVCEQHDEQWVKAYALYVMAFAALTGGRLDEAARLTRECMRISHTFHDLVCTVLSIELLALVQVIGGNGRDAAALQGAAGRIWGTVGLPLFGSAYFNAPHGQCETQAREALGDRDYEAFYQAASRLGLEEAVAFALGELPRPEPSAEPSGAVRR
jgi:non-specific serine/threonine protein kinase